MLKRLPMVTEKVLAEVRVGRETVSDELEQKVMLRGTTCKKGCSHCCYHPVAASLLEGVLLYQHLKKTKKWTAFLKKEIDHVAHLTTGLPPETWMVAQIACPLLKGGLCIGYEGRPFQCKTTWSTGDPDLCHPHRFSQHTPIISRLGEALRFQALERELLRKAGLHYRTVPLALALQLGERIATGDLELDDTEAEVLKEFLQAWQP